MWNVKVVTNWKVEFRGQNIWGRHIAQSILAQRIRASIHVQIVAKLPVLFGMKPEIRNFLTSSLLQI
jgi:hypothetical protein